MTDAGVIDRFFEVFSRYIDSGFGLLGGEVAFLATTLIVIDVTLAALFWAWGPSDDVLARLVKKTLFVGFFAFLIGNFQRLSEIVFASFAGLGLKASGAGMSTADFMRPGKLAQSGIDAGRPMLEAAADMSGFPGFFENFVQIAILLVAFLVVLIAFFVLAIQLFVTLIEFKLTSLAGFVLIPFGLFGKTAFLAERVLGNVVASGVKVLVLAVIVGIGSTLFDTFVRDFGGQPPTLEDVVAITLGALTLMGLAIFGPGIATGLVSGAPQLGAGAAVGAGLAVGGVAMAGAAGVRMAAGAGGTLAGRAGTATAASRSSPGAGAGGSGGGPRGDGLGGAPAGGAPGGSSGTPGSSPAGHSKGRSHGGGSASQTSAPPKGDSPPPQPGPSGGDAGDGDAVMPSAPGAVGVKPPAGATPAPATPSDDRPQWARDMARRQALAQGATITAHALRSGDRGGGSASISLSEDRS
ncbi:P-type conjugative transfer protein TrbL [Brevundimonas sp.]|uniref:P-type conjugative transfer protein TrbL n=1 Tax=Brevundimonas sp. TaxID=1871086 RepID=UPI001ACD863D|nr:P-type conjugative transfer protein TrbL [Brevundimonas sp.]MBN9466281.1 P-type conjugative transfer protein TrbL [Brevundimonas sp.]